MLEVLLETGLLEAAIEEDRGLDRGILEEAGLDNTGGDPVSSVSDLGESENTASEKSYT